MNNHYPLVPNVYAPPGIFSDASIHLFGVLPDVCLTTVGSASLELTDSAGSKITGKQEDGLYVLTDTLGRRVGVIVGKATVSITIPYGVARFVPKVLVPYQDALLSGLTLNGTLFDGNVLIEGTGGITATNEGGNLRIDAVGTPASDCVDSIVLTELRVHVLAGPRPIQANKTTENTVHMYTDFDTDEACVNNNIPGTLPEPNGELPVTIGAIPCEEAPDPCGRIYPETDHIITPTDGRFVLAGTGSALILTPIEVESPQSDNLETTEGLSHVQAGGLRISLEAGL